MKMKGALAEGRKKNEKPCKENNYNMHIMFAKSLAFKDFTEVLFDRSYPTNFSIF